MNDLLEVLADYLRSEYDYTLTAAPFHNQCVIRYGNEKNLYVEVLPTSLRVYGSYTAFFARDFELADPTGLDQALELISKIVSGEIVVDFPAISL